jgi:hypothetical protein
VHLYNYKVKVVGRPIGGRDEPVVDGDLDQVCWEGTSREAPCPPDALRPNSMMRPDGRLDSSAPSILPRGREDSRGNPEDALTREEALVLGVRYMRNRDGEYLGPDEASGMLETPWPEVRRREAVAMRKLRQAGFSPQEIADHFTNNWKFGGPRR